MHHGWCPAHRRSAPRRRHRHRPHGQIVWHSPGLRYCCRMMTLNADDIDTLAAGAGKSPAALFEAIAQVARQRVGAGLVTAMRHDESAATVERVYSSNEQAYPVGG